jgi:hypothetical protein
MTGWVQRSAEMAEDAANAIDRMDEEFATLRKDAERYRKLAASGKFCRASFGGGWGLALGGKATPKQELDDAADALPAVGAA